MFEKLNDSPETEEGKKIRYLNKRKTKSTEEQPEKPTKFKKIDCNCCGAPNWSRQHECPARGKKCAICGKIGYFAKCFLANRKVNHLMEGKTSSPGVDDWTPKLIHSVKQNIHSTWSMNNNGPEFFTITVLVNNRPIKFNMDSRSPVTLIPKSQFNRITPLRPMETEYRDVTTTGYNLKEKYLQKWKLTVPEF